MQKLDRHDGSFIVRYRMFESYRDLTIEILHEGQHVAKSPYTLQGLLVLFVACRLLCRIAHKCYLAITVKLIFIQD